MRSRSRCVSGAVRWCCAAQRLATCKVKLRGAAWRRLRRNPEGRTGVCARPRHHSVVYRHTLPHSSLPRAHSGPARPAPHMPTDPSQGTTMSGHPTASIAPLVGIVMGSRSDWETMQHAAQKLDALGVPHEVRVVSAHRTPGCAVRLRRQRARRAACARSSPAPAAPRTCPGMLAAKTAAAGARRAGAVEGAERPRFAAVDRADAGRRAGGDVRDRQRRRVECGAVRRGDAGRRSSRPSPRHSRRSGSGRPTMSPQTTIHAGSARMAGPDHVANPSRSPLA